jgi:hemerythrin-like metal-binding protein
MAHIEWDERFSTGIDDVDGDHRKLIDLINQLHQAMILGQTRRELPAIVSELLDYTLRHFQREEALMVQHQYPDTEQHRLLHAHFTKMVTNFRAKLELGDFAISTSLFVLLQNWLIEHIMQADREVAWHILNTRLAS